jgi:hypothetical protein
LCFFSVCQLQGFFYEDFVVKSHLRVGKFFVEFIDISKTGLESKIHTPRTEILAFFWDKVHRNSIFLIKWKIVENWKPESRKNIKSRNITEKSKKFVHKLQWFT